MTETTLESPLTISPAPTELGVLAPLYPLPRLELVSGRGAWVTDSEGHEYLDFVSGIAVNALGHVPPGFARAIARQMGSLGHVSNLFGHGPGLELAIELTRATGYEKVFFCNSGTEGIETALKFARARAAAKGLAGRDVLAFRGGFHGRTAFALAATWTPSYREPFEPLVPGVRFADYNDVAALSDLLDSNVAAVIVEPVQGEGGAIPARREFLEALRARTAALGSALIFDEVQSGMGRCGYLLAAEHYGVRGDLTVMSKALGGGIPIAAVLMNADTASALRPGMHGCTFGGSPVATAAGLYMLSRVRKPAFLAGVRRRGRELMRGLTELARRHPSIAAARGLGLLTAIEIAADAPFDSADLVRAARGQGLLLVRGGERAVRLLPPLNVRLDDIREALRRLDQALMLVESSDRSAT
ncbi:MAG TPA: aspartate aminotransferase family protein [Candidatus Udaeobacter sp.]|jgi:predicted acetylornithine/succinylornithine family transaminase|nr:aspartate aminotransferase family protein [Candidatus Udaeobacter sp.]